MKPLRNYTLLLLLMILTRFPLEAQNHNIPHVSDTDTSDLLFDSHDIFSITITSNFTTIFKEIKQDADTVYHDGIAQYQFMNGDAGTVKIELKPRGNYRRNPDHCSFPPLFIKFKKKSSGNTPFEGLDKLKLVTHCSNTQERYDQYVLREYLVYRSYNVLTDSSFRVRLALITYVDTDGKMDTITRYGFFIENEDQMAERLGGKIIEVENIHQDRCNYDLVNLMAVFLYFVANPDWSVSLQHNVKIVWAGLLSLPLTIPYDFDYCGVVNTHYAAPAEELGIETVRERVFRGFCRTKKEFQATFDIFRDKKEEIYDLYRNLKPLSERSLKWSLGFYDKFYETIDDPAKVRKEFLKTCWPNR